MKILFLSIILIFSLNSYCQLLEKDLKYHPQFDINLKPFFHGVASGDATNHDVIIWTRVTPENLVDTIIVKWTLTTDSLMQNTVNSGIFYTFPNRDYTVKVDVKNLKSETFYFYQFDALGKKSAIGRTKTLPNSKEKTENYRPVFFTGSNYNAGFFNAYKSICLRNDIDAVFHLGDYFYEYGNNKYGNNPQRPLMPLTDVYTLDQYRERFSHYRLDKDLQKAHEKYCWYVIWDDHESANNSYQDGAQNHHPEEGNWQVRKAASKKAYFEWMPIREKPDSSIFMTYDIANFARFILLDTRLEGRNAQDLTAFDTNKTMLGKNQLQWLFDQLIQAKKDSVDWIFITQQVMFAPLMIGNKVLNDDQWDGYQYERQKIIDFIVKNNFDNIVIISGDIHTSWANEIYSNTKHKKQGITIPEFITPSITSPSMKKIPAFFGKMFIKAAIPHVKYVDLTHKGYMILNIDTNSVDAEWYFLKTIKISDATLKREKIYSIDKNYNLKIIKIK